MLNQQQKTWKKQSPGNGQKHEEKLCLEWNFTWAVLPLACLVSWNLSASGTGTRLVYGSPSAGSSSSLGGDRMDGIRKLEAVLRILTNEMGDKIPIQQVTAFLVIARAHDRNEEIEVRDVAERSGMSSAATSRNLAALGDWHHRQHPGMKLITLRHRIEDRRRKTIHLTPKGVRLIERLESKMEKAA